jgi:hypothetical protein
VEGEAVEVGEVVYKVSRIDIIKEMIFNPYNIF